jgi:hypothetical protein
LTAQPVFFEGRVFVTIPGEGLVGFESATGNRLWSLGEVSGDVVAIRDGNLLVWNGQHAATVDPRRGDLIVQVPIAGASTLTTDAFVDGNLYVIEPGGRVQKYSPR